MTRIITSVREHIKEWKPLLAAKDHWEDDYNFSSGRRRGAVDNKDSVKSERRGR